MKNLVVIIILIFLAVSCKKDYNCDCKVSRSWSSSIYSSKTNLNKMNKKQAVVTCDAVQNTLKESYSQNTCATCTTTVNCVLN